MILPSKNNLLLLFLSILMIAIGVVLTNYGLNNYQNLNPIPQISPQSPQLSPSQISVTPEASDSGTLGADEQTFLVTKVVDGDTIEIEGGEKIRYIGIDTPESVDPRRPIQCFGVEASNKNKELVGGKRVYLAKDISETDKYGRLLRYVYLPLDDGKMLFVNDYLIREGYAKLLTYPPDVKYTNQFKESETQAREANKGLWQKC